MRKILGLGMLLSIAVFATSEIMSQKRCGCSARPRLAKIKLKPKTGQKTDAQDEKQETKRCGCSMNNKTAKKKKKKAQGSRRILRRFRA